MNRTCREIETLIQLYADGEIQDREMKELQEHVKGCPYCRQLFFDMVDLVTSLEKLGREERGKQRRILFQPLKWTTVIVVVALFAFISSFHTKSQSPQIIPAEDEQEAEAASGLLVFATRDKQFVTGDGIPFMDGPEQVPIAAVSEPAAIYPSEPSIFFKKRPSWIRKVNRFIFIKVRDSHTFYRLLREAGIPTKTEYLEDLPVHFPASFVITTGEQPKIEMIDDPEAEPETPNWFHRLTSQTLITP
ncbi:MAG: zf-HC2 domain-containing protein [Thermoactinomyces sp.]|jgi:hypothetical protein